MGDPLGTGDTYKISGFRSFLGGLTLAKALSPRQACLRS